jgi:hypothetical protein
MDELDDLFKTAQEKFLEEIDSITAKEAVTKYFAIDLDPDVFIDADVGEMVLIAAEILLRKEGAGLEPIPAEIEAVVGQWTFVYSPEDFAAAARAVEKIGQNGSELDLIKEEEGEESYRNWKKYLETLIDALKRRVATA